MIAQGGALLLTALIFTTVCLQPLILFSAHPLLNSAGILALIQSILILQPTHTADQKRTGTIAHSTLNIIAVGTLIAGLTVIEVNKISHNAAHFTSTHGVLGLLTYILLAIQALVGFTQYFVPSLYGGASRAKAVYKWHRASGYFVLAMLLATVIAASQTDTARNMLKLKLWSIVVCSVLVLLGIIPRIKKQKFGLPLSAG